MQRNATTMQNQWMAHKPAWCTWLSLTLYTHIAAHARINQWKQINIFVRAMKFYALRENCFMMTKMCYSKSCSENPFHEKACTFHFTYFKKSEKFGLKCFVPKRIDLFLACMKQNVTGASHLLRMAQRRVSPICA